MQTRIADGSVWTGYSRAVTSGEGTRNGTAHRVPATDRLTMPLVVAGVIGGFLHFLKGVVLLWGGPDLSLVPAMLLLFGLGLVALHRRVSPNDGWARAGFIMAWVAAAFGVASVGCQLAGWQPEDPADPVIADIAYGGGTLAIFVGLLLLGIAWARDQAIPLPWRLVPLAVGIVWFPLEALTAVLPDGSGLMLAGLSWVVAALTPALGTGQRAT